MPLKIAGQSFAGAAATGTCYADVKLQVCRDAQIFTGSPTTGKSGFTQAACAPG